MQTLVTFVDLKNCETTSMYLRRLASKEPRTDRQKFGVWRGVNRPRRTPLEGRPDTAVPPRHRLGRPRAVPEDVGKPLGRPVGRRRAQSGIDGPGVGVVDSYIAD